MPDRIFGTLFTHLDSDDSKINKLKYMWLKQTSGREECIVALILQTIICTIIRKL